jgi:hypothetical protein
MKGMSELERAERFRALHDRPATFVIPVNERERVVQSERRQVDHPSAEAGHLDAAGAH